MKYLFILLIRLYQWCIRPFIGGSCRFYPSCSEYSLEAFRQHGMLKGLFLTLKRIGKCHPRNPGGYDPVPKKKQLRKK